MSESELGNQLSSILTKANKQTCIFVCLCMYVCMRSESESELHSSPPQLKGVRVISACLSASAHRDTDTHTPQAMLKTQAYTCQVKIENQQSLKHSTQSRASQYTVTRNTPITEAMKAQQKCPVAGPTTGCCSKKASCTEEKHRVRQPTSCKTYAEKETKKEQIFTYRHTSTHTQTHKYACWYV